MKDYSTDPIFQTIQQIYDPEVIGPILNQHWILQGGEYLKTIHITPRLNYYRPFKQARLVAEITARSPDKSQLDILNLFFCIFNSSKTTRKQFERGKRSNPSPDASFPAFTIKDWNTAVWTLTDAPCLSELSDVLQPEYFCRHLLSSQDLFHLNQDYFAPQIFRYVPFKRAVLTWDNPTTEQRYFVKLCTEQEFPTVLEHFQKIDEHSASFSFAVPQLVKADVASRSLSMYALPGQQFSELMIHPERIAKHPIFYRVGAALAELHHANLELSTHWTPLKEIKTLTHAMDEVKLALPQWCQAIDSIIQQLIQIAKTLHFWRGYPIHANLFGDQILCHLGPQDNIKIGIVDWDTLSHGDPHYDIGRLIAHYIYLAGRHHLSSSMVRSNIETLLVGYESVVNWKLDHACLTWHIVMQLLLRGKISSLRKLPEQWRSHLDFVITEAKRLLEGRSLYLALPGLSKHSPIA